MQQKVKDLFTDLKSVSKVLYYLVIATLYLFGIQASLALMSTKSTIGNLAGLGLLVFLIALAVTRVYRKFK
jgi:uncharacterized membrane protein